MVHSHNQIDKEKNTFLKNVRRRNGKVMADWPNILLKLENYVL